MEEAKAELWRRGELGWKLYVCQRAVYDETLARDDRICVWEICRRYGKSYMAAAWLCSLAIQKPGAVLHYAAQTAKMVANIFAPNMRTLTSDAPDDVRPVVKLANSTVEFPNGSVIHMAGCEDTLKADRLRGSASDGFVIDEAGFIDCLHYVVTSIAAPQLLTTGGRMLVSSTPAVTVGHHFTEMCIAAEAKGNYWHRNIFDSSVNSAPARVAEFIELCGGEDTPEWRREYMAERVTDTDRAIVPEFGDRKASIIRPVTPPAYYDTYVAMDPGWHPSLTVVLFALYDFKSARLCVLDEIVEHKMTTDILAAAVAAKEQELWGDAFERWHAERPFVDNIGEVYHRVSDTDLRLIQDMSNLHGLDFSPALKDHKEAALNGLRVGFRAGQVQVDPRCKTLIAHLEAGIWNKRRTQFEFVKSFGHFDAIDALLYLWRSLDRAHNPWPSEAFQHGYSDDRFIRPGAPTPEIEALDGLREAL